VCIKKRSIVPPFGEDRGAIIDIYVHFFVPFTPAIMEKDGTRDDIYEAAKVFHISLERRLTMLLKKSFLSEDEEIEMKVLKKRKLYYKDIMEGLKEEP
jgi:hypothetical protein